MTTCLNVLYPVGDGTHFDYEYYLGTHMPMVGEVWGELLDRTVVSKGMAGGPDVPAGYHTVGLAGEGQEHLSDSVSGARKIAFVMGAEGSGLRPAVAKACATLARIPMVPGMESLNVSNAAAIAFYEAMRSKRL